MRLGVMVFHWYPGVAAILKSGWPLQLHLRAQILDLEG